MQQFNYFNTAKAAEMVARKKDIHKAAVAGAQAAGPYGLYHPGPGHQYQPEQLHPVHHNQPAEELAADADKITLIVSLKHQPGSLYRVLSHFARYQINMTNIESRPIPERPWEYYFHMDITGHLTDQAVQNAPWRTCRRIPRTVRSWGTTGRITERKPDHEIRIVRTGTGAQPVAPDPCSHLPALGSQDTYTLLESGAGPGGSFCTGKPGGAYRAAM